MTNTKEVVELLNNFMFLASAYNQIWTIRPVNINGDITIAFVDERTDEIKMTFHNVDETMRNAAKEIQENGWHETKQKYLTSEEF